MHACGFVCKKTMLKTKLILNKLLILTDFNSFKLKKSLLKEKLE